MKNLAIIAPALLHTGNARAQESIYTTEVYNQE